MCEKLMCVNDGEKWDIDGSRRPASPNSLMCWTFDDVVSLSGMFLAAKRLSNEMFCCDDVILMSLARNNRFLRSPTTYGSPSCLKWCVLIRRWDVSDIITITTDTPPVTATSTDLMRNSVPTFRLNQLSKNVSAQRSENVQSVVVPLWLFGSLVVLLAL